MKQNKIATLIKKADIADKFIDKATEIAKSLGYQTDLSYNWGKDTIQTLVISEDLKTVLVVQAIITTSEYNYIRVKDNTGKVLKELSIRADNFDYSVVTPILDFVAETLKQQKTPKQTEPQKPNLTTAEQVYDYGEENNWQNLTNKEYAILAQDVDLARMAVADMQDKELQVPEILKKFRRYSMSFKDVLISKIASEKKANKRVAKGLNKKAAWSDAEKKQVGALDDNAVGKFNIYQDNAGEIFVTKHKLNDHFALMDTAETFDEIEEKIEKDWKRYAPYIGYDKELLQDKSIWQFADVEEDENGIEDLTKDYATEKKAAEDTDVKLKVQKNKPAGLDTSSPKILEGKAKKVFEDMMNASSDLQEVKADIEKFKAKTDKLIQKKIQKSGLDEKTAKLQDLTNKVAQLMEKAQNVVFQNQDKLGVFVNQTKVVPAKFSDKEKIAKLMEYIDKELGKGRAEQYLKNAENGLQSQATEKAIRELVVFEPTKQQKKTSATNDEESSIDTLLNTLKTVYTNLRNYYLSMVKTNNVIEDELLPAVSASKKSNVSKKAGESYGWVVNEEDAQDKLDLWIETVGAEKALDDLRYAMGNYELANNLAYIFRMNDFREGCSDYEEEEETEVESKKKVKVVKKSNVDKKAENMVKMELPLANYMEMLKDRAKEIGRQLYMVEELESYFQAVDTVLEPYIFVDNYLINGQFADKETWKEDYPDEYEKYNGDWNEFCANEAVFYNEDEACLNLGV